MAIYGIDLGTTYSCIAKLDMNGNPEVIRNQEDASDTLASVVYFESETNAIIGDAAKDSIETDGERVVQYAKRYIGKTGDNKMEWTAFGKTYSPIEISSIILKRIKQIAEDQGEVVEDVVITCPAYFGIPERDATRKAGELAGLNVLNLINEPTAAALSYCARQFQENKTIMVYDLGGGTFDVTIIDMEMVTGEDGIERPKVVVVDSDGNDLLGGKDWDDALYNYIMDAVLDDTGLSFEDIEVEVKQDIRSKIEKTKRKLSSKESAKVKIGINGAVTNVEVSKEDFERITSDLVQKTLSYVDAVVQRNSDHTIDTVLLVGGSTYMPMIKEAVENKFPGKVQQHEPDRAVAMGAVIYASVIGNEAEELVIPRPEPNPFGGDDTEREETETGFSETNNTTQVTTPSVQKMDVVDLLPRSFGPGVLNENDEYIVDNLLIKDSEMPASAVKTYYTPVANMQNIVLRAFESKSKDSSTVPCVDRDGNPQETDPSLEVRMLGDEGLVLNLPPNTPKSSPIEVQFQLDAAGLYVKAINSATNEFIDATIKMNAEVDMENSAVNFLSISGE